MEALHEAYRQIHVVEDSDDHNHHYSPVEGRRRINRAVSPSSPPQHARQSLQPASMRSNESGQTLPYYKQYLEEWWPFSVCLYNSLV